MGNFFVYYVTMDKILYSNEQLIDGIRFNNPKILTFIYRHYYPMIENIIINKYKGTTADAKDVFQDSLIVIYEGAISNPPLKIEYSFFTFLATLCKRRMIRKIHRNVNFVSYESEDELLQDSESEISELINKAERIKLYQKHLNEIGEKCRELIKLVLEGYSIKEITKKLNFSSENYTMKRRTQCKDELFKKIYFDSQLKELINEPWTIRKIPRW